MSWMLRLFLACASALLLVVAFPGGNQAWCAWIALVPWLLLLQDLEGRAVIRWSWLIGFLYFLGSIAWLSHVTVVGLIALAAYLAAFFGGFGGLTSRIQRSASAGVALLTIPAAWVAFEFLRSHLLSGFGWNLLAYSQTWVLPAIQIADVTGAWGVSYLVVLVNVALARMLTDRNREATTGAAVVAAVLAVVWIYGLARLRPREPQGMVRVAVIQGNIPQDQKWDATRQPEIIQQYQALTREALAWDPHVVVWPETSVPGYFGLEEPLTTGMLEFARTMPTPILVGAPMGTFKHGLLELSNSAALLTERGIAMRYDKLHLVPWGEFIPFESQAPWLRHVLPPIGDFVPGREATVFEQPSLGEEAVALNSPAAARPLAPFSVLICFEDVFPQVARRFVQRGAQWLVTITNDAWFGKTAAGYQHAQASAFRAVELRVPVVRAANTGWSGCIDSAGRWIASVKDAAGEELFVEGFAVCEVGVGARRSLYVRFGDWFAWLCVVLAGWRLLIAPRREPGSPIVL